MCVFMRMCCCARVHVRVRVLSVSLLTSALSTTPSAYPRHHRRPPVDLHPSARGPAMLG